MKRKHYVLRIHMAPLFVTSAKGAKGNLPVKSVEAPARLTISSTNNN